MENPAPADRTNDEPDNDGSDERPRPRPSRRPRDMVISLAILVVPVLVLIGGYQLVSGRNEPVEVDPAPAVRAAENAGMPADLPEGLPDGWVPMNAVFQPAEGGETGDMLRIGYVTPGGASAQLMQSTVPAEELLEAELPGAALPAGTVEVHGESWQQYRVPDGERALVLLAPDRTAIAIGATSEDELLDLAASISR